MQGEEMNEESRGDEVAQSSGRAAPEEEEKQESDQVTLSYGDKASAEKETHGGGKR